MWDLVLTVSCLKLLFLHCYRSTDFEVHRNWLAITHSLPVREWYTDETSPWTLDYPPFFAWFEWGLSQFAQYFDREMLRVDNLDYASPATVLFQRLSVIASDLVLAWGVKTCSDAACDGARRPSKFGEMSLLVLANAGLLMVDHVHFQYNGFLFGVALHSAGLMLQEKRLQSAFWFAVLLNLKHIYLYCAPAYFVFLLRHYVLESGLPLLKSAKRLAGLGLTVISVFALSFGPFVAAGQLPQVLKRLFPFKRGLCHAYWAPNFWAAYNVADKALATAGKKFLGLSVGGEGGAGMTGGLVQEFDHQVLPSVAPLATFVLALLAMVPALVALWRGPPSGTQFMRALILCSFGSFMFGWHVHEKAILLVIVPLTILSFFEPRDAAILPLCSLTGHVSLLPLLFRPQEALLRLLLVVFYALVLDRWMTFGGPRPRSSCRWQKLYVAGLAGICLFDAASPFIPIVKTRYPFLPLMSYSLYCYAGLAYCWVKLYINMLTDSGSPRRSYSRVKTKAS